ncbi:pgk-1 [Symbiodinium sp. CCMP2456]|nr:pgk-1 [Symbiodinium sp. CCMP2456]
MARSSSVLAGGLLGAASLGGLSFLAPGSGSRQVEVQREVSVAAQAPGFLASTSSTGSAAQGVTGALAVAGLSVAAVRGASAASRQKGIKPRAAKSVVACNSLAKLKIDEVDLKDKRVFIRVDFNVPQDKKDPNIITNTARIDAALPTIKYALDNGAKSVVLCSHLGRPNGQKEKTFDSFDLKDEKFSMKPVVDAPTRPVCGILGGAKVADKIQLIMNLLDKVDIMIIGGGMAFTFIKEAGVDIGNSLYDEEGAKLVPEIKKKAEEKGVELILPVDFVCSSKFGDDGEIQEGDMSTGVPEGFLGLDIGPKSIAMNDEAIKKSKTIVWNGPMGVFEMEAFEKGTKQMMETIVAVTKEGAVSVIGGGDTATACKKYDTVDKVSHCSTGGGASLELLEGKLLPGVAALDDSKAMADA